MRVLVFSAIMLFSLSLWTANPRASDQQEGAIDCGTQTPSYTADQCISHIDQYGELLEGSITESISDEEHSLIGEKIAQNYKSIVVECWAAHRELKLIKILSATDSLLSFADAYQNIGKDPSLLPRLRLHTDELLESVTAYNNGRQSDPLVVASKAQQLVAGCGRRYVCGGT